VYNSIWKVTHYSTIAFTRIQLHFKTKIIPTDNCILLYSSIYIAPFNSQRQT